MSPHRSGKEERRAGRGHLREDDLRRPEEAAVVDGLRVGGHRDVSLTSMRENARAAALAHASESEASHKPVARELIRRTCGGGKGLRRTAPWGGKGLGN